MPEHQSASQKRQKETDKTRRTQGPDSQPVTKESMALDNSFYLLGDLSFNPNIQSHVSLLSGASSEQRLVIARQLQQTYGNQYVHRLAELMNMQTKLSVSTPGDASELEANRVADNVMQTEILPDTVPQEKVQDIHHIDLEGETEDIYEGVPEAINTALEPSLEVPDLTQDTHDKAKAAKERGEYQLAIDFILSEVQFSKMPDLYKCQPPTVKYDAALTAYAGLCSCRYDPETNKAKSVWVTVGNSAFTTVAFLYSTMMHEYEHVLQWFADPKGVAGNVPMAEFDTYTWEIYHAEETGIANLPGTLKSRGKWLKSLAWDKMTPQEQEQNSITYYWALQIIRDLTGDQSWEP